MNESFVKQYGIGVGGIVKVRTFATNQYDEVNAGKYLHPRGPSYDFRVAAVVRTPEDIADRQGRLRGELGVRLHEPDDRAVARSMTRTHASS